MATGIKTKKINRKLGCYPSKGKKKAHWISESDRVIDETKTWIWQFLLCRCYKN